MRLDEIRDLIQLLEESKLSEIEVTRWWGRIRLSKDRQGVAANPTSENGGSVALPASAGPAAAAAAAGGSPATGEGEPAGALIPPAGGGDAHAIAARAAARVATNDPSRYHTISSPMVGTFYRAPAPDADPYVESGQMVGVGQTVCIIEAMKLMNEIESDVRGRVVEILVENTQPVEYGQALILVDPA